MNDKSRRRISALSRILSIAGIAALPLQASALDLTPDASRVLSDPAYLPQQGQVYGATAYSYGRTTGEVVDYLGLSNRSFVTTSNSLSQSVEYGITDDVALRLSESYAQNATTNQFATGASTSSNALGFSNPVVGATWRVLDQSRHAVSWDVSGSYAPDLIQAIGSSPTQDGNLARGGQVAAVGTAVSYETRDFTAYLDANAAYLGRRVILNSNATNTIYQQSWQYSVGLNTQTRLSQALAINAGVTGTFNNSVNAANDTTLATFTSRPGNVTTFNLALLYHITPNRLVAGLIYNRDIYGDSSVNYPTAPASNTTTRNERRNALTARLQYVFE